MQVTGVVVPGEKIGITRRNRTAGQPTRGRKPAEDSSLGKFPHGCAVCDYNHAICLIAAIQVVAKPAADN